MKKENSQAVFFISIVVAVLVILYGVLFSNSLVSMAGAIMAWVSSTFGWLYIAFVFFLVVFLAWLSFSKYGKIKLGRDNEKPEYSNFSWYAMLFCGGTGIGLVFWSIAEPLSHYANPPEGVTAGTVEALNFSIRTCFLHWCVAQWVCFVLVALGIAYFMYREGKDTQISNLLSPLVGEKMTQGWFGKVIDTFSVVVSFAGVATSLGLGVSQICGGLNYLFNVPDNAHTWLIIIVTITGIFLASSISGVDRGIKILSNVNTYIAFALLILAFVVGPKIPIFNTMVNGIGQHLYFFW